jgi:anaerobic magnesium-protoporphyrin IX monomethyl ester cyclase
VTRSTDLAAEDIEFMRWRAERWMKVRHMSSAFRHDPAFVLRNAHRMLAHTFRGSTWRSAIGLEDARDVFRRYRAIRDREREYVDWPDPMPGLSRLNTARPSRISLTVAARPS